jgi:hypothetical protein
MSLYRQRDGGGKEVHSGTFLEDIPTGNFLRLHQHLDNTSHQFKGIGSLNCVYSLVNDRRDVTATVFVCTFGMSGHGGDDGAV